MREPGKSSERCFKRELPKAPFIMIASGSQRTEPAFQLSHRERRRCRPVVIQIRGVHIEIVVIEHIESFRMEFEAHSFSDGEPFCQAYVGIPGTGSAKCVAAGHAIGKRPEVRNAKRRIEGSKAG